MVPRRTSANSCLSARYSQDEICGALGLLDRGVSEGSDMDRTCVTGGWISVKGGWGRWGERYRGKGSWRSLGQRVITTRGLNWRLTNMLCNKQGAGIFYSCTERSVGLEHIRIPPSY